MFGELEKPVIPLEEKKKQIVIYHFLIRNLLYFLKGTGAPGIRGCEGREGKEEGVGSQVSRG